MEQNYLGDNSIFKKIGDINILRTMCLLLKDHFCTSSIKVIAVKHPLPISC